MQSFTARILAGKENNGDLLLFCATLQVEIADLQQSFIPSQSLCQTQ
jgi:hypothetical protein